MHKCSVFFALSIPKKEEYIYFLGKAEKKAGKYFGF